MEEQTVFSRYAIFQTGGKQYQAIEGATVAIEKLEAAVGSTVSFDEVLLKVVNGSVSVGQPFLNSMVKAEVPKHDKEPKKD